jgi:hypothetical protein
MFIYKDNSKTLEKGWLPFCSKHCGPGTSGVFIPDPEPTYQEVSDPDPASHQTLQSTNDSHPVKKTKEGLKTVYFLCNQTVIFPKLGSGSNKRFRILAGLYHNSGNNRQLCEIIDGCRQAEETPGEEWEAKTKTGNLRLEQNARVPALIWHSLKIQ